MRLLVLQTWLVAAQVPRASSAVAGADAALASLDRGLAAAWADEADVRRERKRRRQRQASTAAIHAPGTLSLRDGKPIANERGAVRGMHRRFSWDALNVTNDTACGLEKCYFQGEREGEREGEGWLVGGPRSYLREWSGAWVLAEELRVRFGVDHLLREPPFLATLSRQQAKYLNAKMNDRPFRGSKHASWFVDGTKDGAKRYYTAGPHPVQAVRPCSWPECMVLKCESNPVQDIEGFVANAPNKTKLSLGIKQNFALVAAMVKARPCLKIDFQVYLRNDGDVLNIDLDRCKRALNDKEKMTLKRSRSNRDNNFSSARLPFRRASAQPPSASPTQSELSLVKHALHQFRAVFRRCERDFGVSVRRRRGAP